MKVLAKIASFGLLLGAVLAATLLANILFSRSVFAAGDAAAGGQKAAACVACHGNEAIPGGFMTL